MPQLTLKYLHWYFVAYAEGLQVYIRMKFRYVYKTETIFNNLSTTLFQIQRTIKKLNFQNFSLHTFFEWLADYFLFLVTFTIIFLSE